MKFSISILDYLGKLENGVVVLVAITFQEKYFEATYFYTEKDLVLTIPEELEELLGHPIQEDPDYADVIKEIIKRVVPYTEIYGRIDDIDFKKIIPISEENLSSYLDSTEESDTTLES